jgi:hypothetical protein
MRPARSILQRMAKAAYSRTPPGNIDGFTLFDSTPTLKFYKRGNVVVAAIRGTEPSDMEDLKADGMIGLGILEKSSRFLRDLQKLRQVQVDTPPSSFEWYGVGHSLGGAILDEFLKRKLLRDGLSYNPAVQPGDFTAGLPNQRVYAQGDPLYEVLGKHVPGVEVRQTKRPSLLKRLVYKVPYVGKVLESLDAHALDNFEGGRSQRSFGSQLEKVGLSPSRYIQLARKKAKAAGYRPQDLTFANDGEHKLALQVGNREVKFGRVGYGDHLIWSHLESKGRVPEGTAESRQNRFVKSHRAIKGSWREDKHSPNNLALRILW